MLERRRFLVHESVSRTRAQRAIVDPDSGETLGTAIEIPSTWIAWVRLLTSRRLFPAFIEVREEDDASLLCTIKRSLLWPRHQAMVSDADENLVGIIHGQAFSRGSSLRVHQPGGRIFANGERTSDAGDYHMVSPRGKVLGQVSKIGDGPRLSTSGFIVEIAEHLDNQPLAKMLVLATALAIEMTYDAR